MATYDLTSVSMPTVLEMGDVLNCPYTGDKVSITLPAGRYCLECWGAQGGYRSSTEYGGKGGYSKGILTLKEATDVFLYAGGKGGTNPLLSNGVVSGGFNGGGYRYGYCGGGGASDIRIGTDSLYARVIVAGGGGSDGSAIKGGGAGGGISGQTTPATNYGTGGLGGQSTYSGSSTSTTATTQATSGLNTSNTSLTYGGFGFGGAGLFVNDGYGGAGGGGWYGGQGTLPDTSGDDNKGGGGGSGFVYTRDTASSIPIGYLLSGQYYLTQADTKQGTSSFISPNNTTEMGHSGDGYIRITVGENINDLRRRKSARIQQKGNSSTEWDPNAILLSREIGIETDTNKMKIGDGITPWFLLPYFNSSTSASDEELERLNYYGDKNIIPSDESYFTVNETGETITGLTDAGKTQTELVIPYEINGKKITTLFSGKDGSGSPPVSILDGNNVITKVVIPKSVTTLGSGAFYECTSLTSINIPNSVTSIGEFAFDHCTSLTSINIPNSVTSIGTYAFESCTSLTSINIPNSVTSIGTYAFQNCTSLTSINIPNSVTSIGSSAFYKCTSLTSINIPNSVTSIGGHAFELCTNLTIYCEQSSYAETYAKDKKLPVMYTNISTTYLDKKANQSDIDSINNALSGVYKNGGDVSEMTLDVPVPSDKINTMYNVKNGFIPSSGYGEHGAFKYKITIKNAYILKTTSDSGNTYELCFKLGDIPSELWYYSIGMVTFYGKFRNTIDYQPTDIMGCFEFTSPSELSIQISQEGLEYIVKLPYEVSYNAPPIDYYFSDKTFIDNKYQLGNITTIWYREDISDDDNFVITEHGYDVLSYKITDYVSKSSFDNLSVTVAKKANSSDVYTKDEIRQKAFISETVSNYPVVIPKDEMLAGEQYTDCRVYGNADGFGTLSSSTNKYTINLTCRGKNLIYKINANSLSGITSTINDDGSVTLNGTAASIYQHARGQVSYLPPGTYHLSGCPQGGSEDTYYIKIGTLGVDTGDGVTFTLDTVKSVMPIIYVKKGTVLDNVTFKPQIEIGEVATGFEKWGQKSDITITLDTALGENEYVDVINKKRYNGDGTVSNATVSGEMSVFDSDMNVIYCPMATSPSKIEMSYYKDINKVIDTTNNATNVSTVTSCTGDELSAITSPAMGSIRYVSAVGTGNNTSITPGLYFYLGSWKKVALEDTAIVSNEFVSGGDSTSLK